MKIHNPFNASIVNKNVNSLNVYRSRSNSFLRAGFTAQQNGTAHFCIYNLNGKIIKSEATLIRSGESYSYCLSLTDIPVGYYIVKISTETNNIHTSKILLTK
ncbi:MAG TPA: T9SS type A sorting domain-containing protein [Chitinispirillaceae bacterium]|nr:T9SS type A sorting domain-containing protein [Chitinispirillaceae bacterium]